MHYASFVAVIFMFIIIIKSFFMLKPKLLMDSCLISKRKMKESVTSKEKKT